MRADMKKVLTERPRYGSAYNYNDLRQRENRGDYDDLPCQQGMRMPYRKIGEYKQFNDLIGPLVRYLHGCVGRRWNDVWSEVCQQVGSGNTVDQHLRSHVMMEVDIHTVLVNGEVYAYSAYSGLIKPYKLYVDPRDGRLCYAGDQPNKWKAYKTVTVDGLWYRVGDDGLHYPEVRSYRASGRYPLKVIGERRAMLIDGIWYWIETAVTPPPEDVLTGETVRRVFFARYDFVRRQNVQEGRYYAGKRQMASRDLRRYGLRNTR